MGRTTIARVLGGLVLGASLLGSAASIATGTAAAAARPAGIIMPYGIEVPYGGGHGGVHPHGIIMPWGIIDKDRDGSSAKQSGIVAPGALASPCNPLCPRTGQ
jgi:hypothetical protein